ncbi:putative metal-binding motif-containing protein [Candidatus Uhrbacteria bacterium]|nr:putative metal-binding motif-containing protein [Candidatus Uhrbacteria bacterium]
MSYLYKVLFVFMLVGGCGGVEEEIDGEGWQRDPLGTTENLVSTCEECTNVVAIAVAATIAAGYVIGPGDEATAIFMGFVAYQLVTLQIPVEYVAQAIPIAIQLITNGLRDVVAVISMALCRDTLALCEPIPTLDETDSSEDVAVELQPCTPNWSCNAWSECVFPGFRSRLCTDLAGCAGTPPVGATSTTQTEPCDPCGNGSCEDGETCTSCPADCGTCPPPTCTPAWSCSGWSACSCSGTRTRTCADLNSCGTATGRPSITSRCVVCGNGSCDCGETCASCSGDCGVCPPPPSCTCADGDRDGHYDPTRCGDSRCSPRDDCNDSNAAIYAGAPEICNGLDDNCNGTVDESGVCPPPDPEPDPPGTGEICGNDTDDNGNGDPWDGCECRPIYGQSTRCVDGRYYEACNRGNWRRDNDCLEFWQCPGRGICVFLTRPDPYAQCICP